MAAGLRLRHNAGLRTRSKDNTQLKNPTNQEEPAAAPRYFGLIPAAGSGARMGSDLPKQYLDIAGKPMIAHAIGGLLSCARIERVFVVLAADDLWWDRYSWQQFGHRLTILRCGGATRADSVANGLAAMGGLETDWVLVHDAARPGLTGDLVERLLNAIADDAVGGLLAVPLADTLKLADEAARVRNTPPREHLWQAQTPQMFRCGLLHRALLARSVTPLTDEASAVELLGLAPLLVASRTSNFKVTYPEDLALARAWQQALLSGAHLTPGAPA